MIPNIEWKGRVARAITGTLCIVAGLAVALFVWPDAPTVRWTVGGLLMLAGVFQLFEARKSWCVMRACGVRTPM